MKIATHNIAAKSNECKQAANFSLISIFKSSSANIVPLLRYEQKKRLIFSNKNIDL